MIEVESTQRLTKKAIAKLTGLSEKTVDNRMRSAIARDPDLLEPGPRPRIGRALTYSSKEVKRFISLTIAHPTETPVDSLYTPPDFDPKKEFREMETRLADRRQEAARLQLTNVVLSFIANKYMDKLPRNIQALSRDISNTTKTYVRGENNSDNKKNGESQQTKDEPEQPVQIPDSELIGSLISTIGTYWDRDLVQTGVERQIILQCRQLKNEGYTKPRLTAELYEHFKKPLPEDLQNQSV